MIGTRLWPHKVFVVLVVIGALVRTGMMFAYYPAFGYFGDSYAYLLAEGAGTPGPIWPFGYSAWLKFFDVSTGGHLVSVSIVQHLLGLAMGVVVYALLIKRGVRRGWSALAAAPVLLDARQIQLEHYVLSETLFTFLILTGIAMLMWHDKPPLWLMGLSGLAFALATLTRTVGQPLAVLVVLYLLVRRIGWRRVAVFVVALAIPIGGYMVWYERYHGTYALNGYAGRYMWQRTTTFVDCTRTDFTPEELDICPPEPLGQREINDVYLWGLDRNAIEKRHPGPQNDKLFQNFAIKAIKGQPVDFLATVFTDAWHMIKPGWQQPKRIGCTTDLWTMSSGNLAANHPGNCTPTLMSADFRAAGVGPAATTVTTLNSTLWSYGQTFVFPPWMLVLSSLFALGTAAWRTTGRRRFGWREAADSALPAVMCLSMLLLSVTLSVIDLRFMVPMLPLAPLAAALAAHRIASRPAGAPTPSADGPDDQPDTTEQTSPDKELVAA